MTRSKITNRELATAQAILDHKDVIEIRSVDLSDILHIDIKRAGMLLKRLGWRLEKLAGHRTVWHRDGSHKDYPHQPRNIIVKRAELLGVILN